MNTTGIYNEPRKSERLFRRYESLIAEGVSRFPAESKFPVPEDLSPAYFLARFRDAILSLSENHWETYVDKEKLVKIRKVFVLSLSPDGKAVWFRQRQRQGRPTTPFGVHEQPVDRLGFETTIWRDVTNPELEALCLLIHTQRLAGPYTLQQEVDQDYIDQLQTRYNVALIYDSAKNETLIT